MELPESFKSRRVGERESAYRQRLITSLALSATGHEPVLLTGGEVAKASKKIKGAICPLF